VLQEVRPASSPSEVPAEVDHKEQDQLEEFEEPITGVARLIRPWLWCREQKPKPVKKKDKEEEKKSGETGTTSVLQKKLNRLAIKIGYGGTIAAITCFFLLVIRFGIEFGVHDREWDHNKHWEELLHFAIISITVLVVAVPEGLPLAVTIALAYSVQKMLLDNNLVRHLHACETMGNATTICSDKTGTLTLNRMTVVEVYLAGKVHKCGGDSSSLLGQLPQSLLDLLQHCIVLNCSYSSRVEEVHVCMCSVIALLEYFTVAGYRRYTISKWRVSTVGPGQNQRWPPATRRCSCYWSQTTSSSARQCHRVCSPSVLRVTGI